MINVAYRKDIKKELTQKIMYLYIKKYVQRYDYRLIFNADQCAFVANIVAP